MSRYPTAGNLYLDLEAVELIAQEPTRAKEVTDRAVAAHVPRPTGRWSRPAGAMTDPRRRRDAGGAGDRSRSAVTGSRSTAARRLDAPPAWGSALLGACAARVARPDHRVRAARWAGDPRAPSWPGWRIWRRWRRRSASRLRASRARGRAAIRSRPCRVRIRVGDLRPGGVAVGRRVRRPHRRHLPPGGRLRARCGSRSTGPRCATRSGRTPSTSSTAASTTRGCRPTSAACCSRATARRRRTAAGRSARAATSASAAGRATSTNGAVETGASTDRPGAARSAAHPGVPAADPLHAQGGDRRGSRLGGRRRPQPARRVRPDAGRPPSTRASSRPTPTWPRSTAGSARRTSPGRSARSSPARSSSSARSTTPRPRTGWAWSTPWCRTPSSRSWRWTGRGGSTRKSPTAQRMLKYAFNLIDDGLVGQQLFAGEATRLAYGTEEAAEGRDAFLEKRAPTGRRTPTTTETGLSAQVRGCAWGHAKGTPGCVHGSAVRSHRGLHKSSGENLTGRLLAGPLTPKEVVPGGRAGGRGVVGGGWNCSGGLANGADVARSAYEGTESATHISGGSHVRKVAQAGWGEFPG